jgi:excisionase family DNA binding protein
MAIRNLATHPAHYVTVAELAEYWAVSRQQIYMRIESGALNAIRLGSRLYRVRTQAALEFERRASVAGNGASEGETHEPSEAPASGQPSDKLPKKIGLQRVRRVAASES